MAARRSFSRDEARGVGEAIGIDWVSALSPDGSNLYFAFNIGRHEPGTSTTPPGGITVFSRDARDGSLKRLGGSRGCFTETGSRGACTRARGIESPSKLAISPDGRNVYTSGFTGRDCCRDGNVAVFRRAP